jgi:hypothetical protein
MNSIQNIRLTLALIITALAVGCDAPDEAAPVAFEDRSFSPAKVSIRAVGSEHRLTFTGSVDNAPVELYVDLHLNNVVNTLGATHNLGGETFFETANFARFMPFEEHSNTVVRAYAMGACTTCELDGNWQLVTGTLTVDSLTDNTIVGRISVVVEGDIPLASGLRNIRTFISGPFETAVAQQSGTDYQPVAPAPEVDPVEPTPEPPVDNGQPTGTTTQDSAPEGPNATAVSPVYEATLHAGWGVNLATGETFKKANFANSDLYATAGHPYLKLTPGGTSPTHGQPLRWFKNSGGFVKSFGALTEVPLELPTAADGSQSIVSAKPYMGFIVKANLTDVYARVWVRTASADTLTLEYQLISEAP